MSPHTCLPTLCCSLPSPRQQGSRLRHRGLILFSCFGELARTRPSFRNPRLFQWRHTPSWHYLAAMGAWPLLPQASHSNCACLSRAAEGSGSLMLTNYLCYSLLLLPCALIFVVCPTAACPPFPPPRLVLTDCHLVSGATPRACVRARARYFSALSFLHAACFVCGMTTARVPGATRCAGQDSPALHGATGTPERLRAAGSPVCAPHSEGRLS